ncbi:MAG: nicotinate-nucleotide--dimethylbenzimidazole phosphoribosyltransferase [Sphaerochaetaceae bacterium]
MSIKAIDYSRLPYYEKQLLEKAMPPNSLGRLGTLALKLALIKEGPLDALSLLLFAADHGVVEEGVTHSPQQITYQQCRNFASGGGACSLFASLNHIKLSVIDVGVNHSFLPSDAVIDCKIALGTKNFLHGPAMEREACLRAMEVGRDRVRMSIAEGIQAIAFGEMGVGNTTSASAIAAALTKKSVSEIAGKGSGLSEQGLLHKISIIEHALLLHKQRDPLSVLCSFGGYEIAAICGGMLEAAEHALPILLDGFVVTSAALVANEIEPNMHEYLIPCHQSGMQGHRWMLEALGCDEPLLDLQMQLGEGTGTLAAWPLIRLASHLLSEMTSFSEAHVTDSTKLLQTLGVV